MKRKLRIVQLIDSLEAGGAERMAVNYANTLAEVLPFSALVTTRKEGALKAQLSQEVGYLFLDKKGKLGLSAVLKFRNFIKRNKVDVIHAHSTSFFTAVLVKVTYPKVKIVWHDHFGNRATTTSENKVLKAVSFLFYGVLTVNKELEQWAKEHLAVKNVRYFANFISSADTNIVPQTLLKGSDGKRIVFLANLKKPKNHLQMLKAYLDSEAISLGWSIHLIGKDNQDVYSNELKNYIEENRLQDFVFIYDSCTDVESILSQANVGILGSTYEGFPVTLLEYGKAKLAVISTDVGYCKTIIRDAENGLLFSPNDISEVVQKINAMIKSEPNRMQFANELNNEVMNEYSDKVIIHQYLEWLGEL